MKNVHLEIRAIPVGVTPYGVGPRTALALFINGEEISRSVTIRDGGTTGAYVDICMPLVDFTLSSQEHPEPLHAVA